jgi:hypothetical protein
LNSATAALTPEKIIETLKPTTSAATQSKPPAISSSQLVVEQKPPEKPIEKPPAQLIVSAPPEKPIATYPSVPLVSATKPPEKIVDSSNQVQLAQITFSEPIKPEPVFVPPKIEPALASIATLKEIQSQGNPKRAVSVKLNKSVLRIGKDSLDMTIKSSHDGYVYLVLLGSDSSSFYVLFPNGLDQNNRVKAGQTIRIPKADWEVKANGPSGTDNLLVMVADSPRKLNALTMAEPTASEPFTYALNDIGGRGALIDFLTGSGVDGKSESFGSALVSIKEVK